MHDNEYLVSIHWISISGLQKPKGLVSRTEPIYPHHIYTLFLSFLISLTPGDLKKPLQVLGTTPITASPSEMIGRDAVFFSTLEEANASGRQRLHL
jgi:hypothetical protein